MNLAHEHPNRMFLPGGHASTPAILYGLVAIRVLPECVRPPELALGKGRIIRLAAGKVKLCTRIIQRFVVEAYPPGADVVQMNAVHGVLLHQAGDEIGHVRSEAWLVHD